MINKSTLDFLASLAITLPAVLLAISVHEFAHVLVASLLGDDTAKKMGRLTLNPMAHVDYTGMLLFVLFRFGWANAVIFDPRNFKHKKLYSVLTALAGPFANFLFTLFCFVLLKYVPLNLFPIAVTKAFVQLLTYTASFNVWLGVFNLLPIPPLDGGRLVTELLSYKYPNAVLFLYRYSFAILIVVVVLPLLLFPAAQELYSGLIKYVYVFLYDLVF